MLRPREQGYTTLHSMSSVRPSFWDVQVCFFHKGWNTSKMISRLNSLRYLLGLTLTWTIWSNGNTPQLGWNRGLITSTSTCNISETVQNGTKVLWRQSHIRAFDCMVPKSMTLEWMNLNGRYALLQKRFSQPTRRKCRPMILVSRNIRYADIR